MAGIEVIHLDRGTLLHEIGIHKEGEALLFKLPIVDLWLIQSQSQRGPRSAPLHDGHPQGGINLVVLHVGLQIPGRHFRDLQHNLTSLYK